MIVRYLDRHGLRMRPHAEKSYLPPGTGRRPGALPVVSMVVPFLILV